MKDVSRRHAIGLGAVAVTSAMLPKLAAAANSDNSIDVRPKYKILSFCGGGIRGLASVTMLNVLYQKFPGIISGTDLLTGCSTGSGIVAGLVNGKTPEDLINYYLTTEAKFFKVPSKIPSLPAYSIELFASGVHSQYGQQTLNDISENQSKRVVLASFKVGDEATPWEPILFNNFPGSSTGNTLLADAVVSSGAMPGMFGSYQGNVDGAFVHHDPTLAAIALAVNSGVNPTDIVAICFGTGFMANSLGKATSHWGAEQWQIGDPKNPYNTSPLLINGTSSPILNISLNGTSTNLMPMLNGMLLPKRYAYLNPTLEFFIPENDADPADLDYLQAKSLEVDFSPAEKLLASYW
jgi:hypothetical protein